MLSWRQTPVCALKLSDFPTPGSPQGASAQFLLRRDQVVLHNARRAKKLEAYADDAEGAMMVAMCKLELCLRDRQAGGSGEVDRVIPMAPAQQTVGFVVNGTEYKDELTQFDNVPTPFLPTPLLLLSNRALV